jgi:hypothetical protein
MFCEGSQKAALMGLKRNLAALARASLRAGSAFVEHFTA